MSTKQPYVINLGEALRESLSQSIMGRSRTSPCVGCDNPDLNFRDELSRKEYWISRFCQTCQDSVFGVEDPNELDSD